MLSYAVRYLGFVYQAALSLTQRCPCKHSFGNSAYSAYPDSAQSFVTIFDVVTLTNTLWNEKWIFDVRIMTWHVEGKETIDLLIFIIPECYTLLFADLQYVSRVADTMSYLIMDARNKSSIFVVINPPRVCMWKCAKLYVEIQYGQSKTNCCCPNN